MQEFINEILKYIEKDSMLTLLTMISIVVVLVILLVLVVSSMRIKIYKDRWWNVKVDNQEKATYITKIERELQALEVQNASKTQELLYFVETKETLRKSTIAFSKLEKEFYQGNQELTQVQAQLDHERKMKEKLEEEHKVLLARFDSTVEENMKHRTNNARLLSKIEAEAKNRV